jgi:hypothetical protein
VIELTLAAIAVALIVAAIVIALAMGVKRELEHTDEWWQPSESGRLAKLQYDEKQAAKEQKQILRNANKPTYQQPNRSNS